MAATMIRGGRVVDPVTQQVQSLDILVDGDRIVSMSPSLPRGSGATEVDVSGHFVLPGLIDPHVHLREPGQGYKETIESGTRAAAAGGFTQVCCMPNTKPVTDTPEIVRWIIEEANRYGHAKVHPIAAITVGLAGEELTDFAALLAAGAVAFSDDGRGVQRADRMLAALMQARALGVPIVVHAEDETLSAGGHIHDGDVARDLQIPGIPSVAESVMIGRDILLAEHAKAHVHMCHVSPASAVALIAEGKRRGIHVTAEVTSHHLLLTEEAVRAFGSAAKVNPPLRSEADRAACVQGLLDATLDMIVTDHAPHAEEEKSRPITEAPFGFTGIEISFPLMYTAFVDSGIMTLPSLVAKMSTVPAAVFGLQGGRLLEGGVADLTVIDPRRFASVNPELLYSKGKTTPFIGRHLTGWPVLTMCNGRITHDVRR